MYSPDFFKQTGYLELITLNQAQLANTKPKIIITFNHLIMQFVDKLLLKGQSKLDWIVCMPHSKLGLLTLFWIILMSPLVLINVDDKAPDFIEMITILFMATLCTSMSMESKLILFQIKPVAHLFSINNHRQLKETLLHAVEKSILLNAVLVFMFSHLLIWITQANVDSINLIAISIIILCLSFIFTPILLCLKWVKVSFPQVGVLVLYMALIFASVKLMKILSPEIELAVFLIGYIVLSIIMRQISKQILWQKPLETLFKNA